jgi:hypothetical protein
MPGTPGMTGGARADRTGGSAAGGWSDGAGPDGPKRSATGGAGICDELSEGDCRLPIACAAAAIVVGRSDGGVT